MTKMHSLTWSDFSKTSALVMMLSQEEFLPIFHIDLYSCSVKCLTQLSLKIGIEPIFSRLISILTNIMFVLLTHVRDMSSSFIVNILKL